MPQIEPVHLKAVALAGGVGGARLAHGLAQALPPEGLTIIVNVGDDFEHFGLKICPDLDTVLYTLADVGSPATGWGRAGETYQVLETLGELGGPTWFRLGDRDLGLHLERTRRFHLGKRLSQITAEFCRSFGVGHTLLPATDDTVPTWVYTEEGELPFQEYFVRRQCRPRVTGFRFGDVETARAAPGVLEALNTADLVIVCPSNPWVSVDPILAIPGIRSAIQQRRASGGCKTLAVSPILGGQTIKGPAAKMYAEMGIEPSAFAVAQHYAGWLDGFVLDRVDESLAAEISRLGMCTLITDTLMKTPADRLRLAQECLQFGLRI